MKSRVAFGYGLLLAMLSLLAWGTLSWGPMGFLSPGELFQILSGQASQDNRMATAVIHLRLPRLGLAWGTGAALGVAGLLVQGAFRNPLAEPYLLGVSAGAGLGAVLAVSLGLVALLPIGGLPLGAFIGAWAAIACLFALSYRWGTFPPTRVLLAGIAFGGIFQAITTFLLLKMHPFDMRAILFWLMGSFAYRDLNTLLWLLPGVGLGFILALWIARSLDLLTTGDWSATSMGVPVQRTRALALLTVAWLAALATAASGIIAFAGLIVPHLCRPWIGPNHRLLLPATALTGAALLSISDLVSRLLLAGQELPLSLITGLLGALFFLSLLSSSSNPSA